MKRPVQYDSQILHLVLKCQRGALQSLKTNLIQVTPSGDGKTTPIFEGLIESPTFVHDRRLTSGCHSWDQWPYCWTSPPQEPQRQRHIPKHTSNIIESSDEVVYHEISEMKGQYLPWRHSWVVLASIISLCSDSLTFLFLRCSVLTAHYLMESIMFKLHWCISRKCKTTILSGPFITN